MFIVIIAARAAAAITYTSPAALCRHAQAAPIITTKPTVTLHNGNAAQSANVIPNIIAMSSRNIVICPQHWRIFSPKVFINLLLFWYVIARLCYKP